MQRVCWDHFGAIDSAEALYVLDPGGYVGTLVKVEIGYALGKRKAVYFSEKTGSLDLDSLPKDVISLDRIDQFLEMRKSSG